MQEVLEASPEGPGREAFLMRRAGVIDGEDRVELGSPIGYEWHLSQIAGNIAPDTSADTAHGVASGWQHCKLHRVRTLGAINEIRGARVSLRG